MSLNDNRISDTKPKGRGYGYGGYGKPWAWGEQGYEQRSTSIITTIPIASTTSIYVHGHMGINHRYTEDVDTVEDIQSFYTEGYMKLGCYDGPILPLYLTDQTEKEDGS